MMKRFQEYKNNPRARIAATFIASVLIGFTILADQKDWWYAWTGQSKSDVTVDCPDLNAGCNFRIGSKAYQVKSDIPLEPGKPFMLDVSGEIAAARAVWRMTSMDMGPNNYRLAANASGVWQAQVTLPPCPQGSKDWQLHLEINGRGADINTRVR